jgi:hypothetical protein
MFQAIEYKQLNSRQKENYNFQKIAAKLADYGFNCMWLNDDWQGADFIACHIDGTSFLKVQLKGRLTINQIYNAKDIYIAFNQNGDWYIYPHDIFRDELLNNFKLMLGTKSWDEHGSYSWPQVPNRLVEYMKKYRI